LNLQVAIKTKLQLFSAKKNNLPSPPFQPKYSQLFPAQQQNSSSSSSSSSESQVLF
jgi:hypothetical protein